MTAASTVKPKTKFSSRNVNALYKAPALRVGDSSGVSAGYRVGGVNGLNRMLVLRGPVRGGALEVAEANAVAAPTPINTPSLRKEHLGQDIHVSLVPAGKGSGWGSSSASDGSVATDGSHVEADVSNGHATTIYPSEPRPPMRLQGSSGRAGETVWNGSVSTVVASQTRPTARPAKGLFASASNGSGRWGDDAVEEDFAQGEIHRDMEHKKEFPDLREQHGSNQFYARDRVTDHSSNKDSYIESQDARSQRMQASMIDNRPRSAHAIGYDDHGVVSISYRPSDNNRSERTSHGYHMSVQDARYGSPGRNEASPRAALYQNEMHHDVRHHSLQPARGSVGGATEQRSRAIHDHRPHQHHDLHRSVHPRVAENETEHGGISTPQMRSQWMASPNASPSAENSSSVWKMGETDVNPRPVPEHAYLSSSSNRAFERTAAVGLPVASAYSSPVRILKRSGPRMLFDHKSGTMIEVEESKSSRRMTVSEPTQAKMSTEVQNSQSAKVDEVFIPVEVATRELERPPSILNADLTDESIRHEDQPSLPPAKTETHGGSTRDVSKNAVLNPKLPKQDKSSNSKARSTEPKTKRLAMGGKLRRVVVAYRPVTASGLGNMPDELPSSSQLLQPPKLIESKSDEQLKQVERQKSRRVTRGTESHPIEKEHREKTSHRAGSNPKKSVSVTCTEKPKKQQEAVGEKKKHPSMRSETNLGSKHRSAAKLHGSDPNLARTKTSLETHLPVEDSLSSESVPDDGGGAFKTVKSRRVILLEKKKQRDELAAALSGFHERGGVRRSSNRVSLPASVSRFGKKGLVVGYKQKVEVTSVVVPAPLPVFEKSFIDVIRPPSVVRDTEHSVGQDDRNAADDQDAAVLDIEPTKKAHPRAKRRIDNTSVPTKNPTKRENASKPSATQPMEKTSSPQHIAEAATNLAIAIQDNLVAPTSKTEDGGDRAAASTNSTRRVSNEKRTPPGKGVKREVKKIYVPKVIQAPSEATVADAPVHSAVSTTPSMAVESSPVVSIVSTSMTSEHAAATEASYSRKRVTKDGPQIKKKISAKSTALSQAPAETSASAAIESPVAEPSAPLQNNDTAPDISSTPASAVAKKSKRKLSKKTDDPSSQHQKSLGIVKSDSNNHKSAERSATPSVEPRSTATPSVEPRSSATTESPDVVPPKLPRRSSNTKATTAKSLSASSSSQKIYKKVYVVKATPAGAAASPSAA